MWSERRELDEEALASGDGRTATAAASLGACKVKAASRCCKRRLPALEVETQARMLRRKRQCADRDGADDVVRRRRCQRYTSGAVELVCIVSTQPAFLPSRPKWIPARTRRFSSDMSLCHPKWLGAVLIRKRRSNKVKPNFESTSTSVIMSSLETHTAWIGA